jgi:Lipocalin-like domain
MKMKALLLCALLLAASAPSMAKGPKLDGAYRYVSTSFPGGKQTDAETKGMLVVHGKYMAFVRANVDRKTWDQQEPAEERAKKIVAAYQGLAATCGEYAVEGNVITLQQIAQASPLTMGKPIKWEYKLEGNTLKLKPVSNPDVEFTFERMPE